MMTLLTTRPATTSGREQDECRGQPGGKRLAAGPAPGTLAMSHRPGRDRLARGPSVEVVGQRRRGRVPPVGLFAQAGQADRLQVAVETAADAGRGLGLAQADLLDGFEDGIAPKRRPAASASCKAKRPGRKRPSPW